MTPDDFAAILDRLQPDDGWDTDDMAYVIHRAPLLLDLWRAVIGMEGVITWEGYNHEIDGGESYPAVEAALAALGAST